MMSSAIAPAVPPGKFRTALVLALIALGFFVGVIVRHWLW